MKLDIVFPRVGTPGGGISDHSRMLAEGLTQRGHEVRLIGSGETFDVERDCDPLPQAQTAYVNGWPRGQLTRTDELLEAILKHGPDVVMVQFEQFSYGVRGFNPGMARFFSRLRAQDGRIACVLFAHETYPTPSSPTRVAMWLYQRAQLAQLVSSADSVIHSSHRGYRLLESRNEQSVVIPVHSNIPITDIDPSEARLRMDLPLDDFVVLVFGAMNDRRGIFLRSAIQAVASDQKGVRLVYVGKDSSRARALGDADVAVTTMGPLPADQVSFCMRAADMALSPFGDGVSGRRGSFAALMTHGVPTVTNRGKFTDEYLSTAAAYGAFSLSANRAADFASEAVKVSRDGSRRDRMRSLSSRLFSYRQTAESTVDAVESVLLRSVQEVAR